MFLLLQRTWHSIYCHRIYRVIEIQFSPRIPFFYFLHVRWLANKGGSFMSCSSYVHCLFLLHLACAIRKGYNKNKFITDRCSCACIPSYVVDLLRLFFSYYFLLLVSTYSALIFDDIKCRIIYDVREISSVICGEVFCRCSMNMCCHWAF